MGVETRAQSKEREQTPTIMAEQDKIVDADVNTGGQEVADTGVVEGNDQPPNMIATPGGQDQTSKRARHLDLAELEDHVLSERSRTSKGGQASIRQDGIMYKAAT